MKKALFLDRDGVINHDYGYVFKTEDVAFIDGIFQLCRSAQEKGYLIIIVTNQSGIERGFFTEAEYEAVTRYMTDCFAKNGVKISAVFHCPYLRHEDRKPNPGMFLKAQKQFDIDMAASLAVGDKERDSLAAKAAGVSNTVLFGVPPEKTASLHSARSLSEIEQWL